MNELMAIGEQHGIPVIEDAAEAIGSIYHGRRAGSMGKFGTFSFHGSKTITTGEGGMFVTDDADLYEHVLTLSNHGRARGQPKQFWPDMVGFKYKMSNIQAAIGYGQMERIEELIARKRDILAIYRTSLAGLKGLNLNPERPETQIGAWMPTVVFARETGIIREHLQKAFLAENIDARVFFWPLSTLPPFSVPGVRTGEVAQDICTRAINLPSYHALTESEQSRVVAVIEDILD